jgi:hypothetical protein
MAVFKGTWFYYDTEDTVGWTETWWGNASDFTSAVALFNGYAPVRQALMYSTSFITQVRISNVDSPRDSLIIPTAGLNGPWVTATTPRAGIWDCLLLRRDAVANNVFGHLFLHLIPAGVFVGRTYGPVAPVSTSWNPAFAAFQAYVTAGNLLLRKRVPPAAPTYPPCTQCIPRYRTERRLGRPSDPLRGRRAVA